MDRSPVERIRDEERERCAELVETMITQKPWSDKPWCRVALSTAARAIRRGRHLTEREKLINLANAIEEPDCTDDDRRVAAKLREIAG